MSNKKMFKNLVIFKIDDIKEADLKKIERMSALKDMPSSVTSNKGFTNYLEEGDNLYEKVNKFYFLKFKEEKRDVPSSVVNELVKEKEIEHFNSTKERLSKKEKKQLKEEITHSLLPKAFIKSSYVEAYIDFKNNYLVFNISSLGKADKFIAELKKYVDFSFSMFEPNIPLTDIMTGWVKENKIPDPFALEDSCSLFDPLTNGTTDYKKENIEERNEELLKNIEKNKVVKSIKINWHERISFVLNDQLILKSLNYNESFEESIEESAGDAEDEYNHFQATMTILCEDIAELFQDIMKLE